MPANTILYLHMIESDSCQHAKLAWIRRYSEARGWRVVRAITDDPAAAAWSEGTLSLAPCAGILLLAERLP